MRAERLKRLRARNFGGGGGGAALGSFFEERGEGVVCGGEREEMDRGPFHEAWKRCLAAF